MQWGWLALAATIFAATMPAGGRTTADGVYTSAQAQRGQVAYAERCASCHRADLGGFSGPPLKGDLFMDRWREFNLSVLDGLIRNTMPATAPGTLSQENYLDILTYILQSNELPAGGAALTAAILPDTLLVGKDGPKPLPTSAQVEVVGCMTEDSGNGFFLTSASDAARTLDMFSLTPEELNDAKTKPLGSRVFRLENLADIAGFKIETSAGKKMAAKGVLVRQSKGDRINVTALQSTGAACEP
jgi:S-disulfanyl-L-cysteine oxidoreductase SoxD